MNEKIVLLDQGGKPIGEADKLSSHHADTPLHLAFSCYIFNQQGEFLVTKRALTKKVWPGVLTNSVCGHPAPDEGLEDAIIRRSEYEIGLSLFAIKNVLPRYQYKTPPYNGIIEHELCPVFVARTNTNPTANPDEVDSWHWISWSEYVDRALNDESDIYSWWCKDQLKQFKDQPLIASYAKSLT